MKTRKHARFFRFISHTLFIAAIVTVATLYKSPPASAEPSYIQLASKTISLEKRYANTFVNDVFKDNILLTASYMAGASKTDTPDWEKVKTPFNYDFTLNPGEVFAFQDSGFLPEYAQNVVKTTNAHYIASEGFKSDGYLMGDGVCHFASLIYWAAKDAQLEAVSPINHDFAAIPEIDKEYGVSIYADPTNVANSMRQNLYIRNNKAEPITFRIIYNGADLTVEILKNA